MCRYKAVTARAIVCPMTRIRYLGEWLIMDTYSNEYLEYEDGGYVTFPSKGWCDEFICSKYGKDNLIHNDKSMWIKDDTNYPNINIH